MATKVKNLKLGDELYLASSVDVLLGDKITSVTGSSGVSATTTSSKEVTVTAKVSSETGNIISVKTTSGKEGLYAPPPAAGSGISVNGQTISVEISSATGNGLFADPDGLGVTAASLGLGSAYIPKGSTATSALNASDTVANPSSAWQEGWVYNVSDSGSLVNGLGGSSIAVTAGDNVVRVKDGNGKFRWDKLSSTVNVPVTSVAGSSPVTVTSSGGTFTAGLNYGGGLSVPDSGEYAGHLVVAVRPGYGLEAGSSGVGIVLNSDSGLTVNSSGLAVGAGDGISVAGSSVSVNLTSNSGLTLGSSGLSVGAGDGIGISGSSIYVKTSGPIGVNEGDITLRVGAGLQATSGSNSMLEVLAEPGKGISVGSSGVAVDYGDGLEINGSSKLAVKPTNGIEVSGSGVGVKCSTVTNHKSIDVEGSGAFVSLNRALSVASGSSIPDTTTISAVLTALGGTLAS